MPEPTPEQLAAIETEGRPLLVEAGAGTGKTWVLVRRFLHLLERHPDWPLESIVAVTFTEKAAREMRTRIRQSVEAAARAAPPGSPWQARRRELERMQVGTIHSLCARLLRENAVAAGLDPRFEVLDEVEAGLLKEEALALALAALVDEESPALGLLASLEVRDLRDGLATTLAGRGAVKRLFAEAASEAELLERWRAGVAEMRRQIWNGLQRSLPSLRDALQALPQVSIQDEADRLSPAAGLAQDGCRRLAGGDLAEAASAWLGIKLTGGKAENWGGRENLDALKAQLKVLREAAQSLEKYGCLAEVDAADVGAARALAAWRALWDRLEAVYARLKADRRALDFDDLELSAEQLLYAHPRNGRLQAALDGIRHLMVDEFQDTNAAQQRIVYALAHPQAGGRLFVVGDAKQSIYRFRQAQVTIFNRTAQDIWAAGKEEPVRLRRSFRTQAALTAALNRLFDQALQPDGETWADFEAPPGSLEAHRPAPAPQPCAPAPVEVMLLPETDGDKPLGAEQVRLFEARLLAERLLRLQADGFLIWDKEKGEYRPFQFSDAAVLFRATTSLPLYEEQFKAAGLPYLTVSGRGYYDRPEVRDLTALLACLYSPADDLSLAAVLRSPFFSLSDETLYRLRRHRPEGGPAPQPVSLARALANPPPTGQPGAVAFAAEAMAELWGLTGRAQVWELLRLALDRTGYEAVLAVADRESGGRSRSNLLKFLELARARAGASLSEFLRRVEDLRVREAREGEAPGATPESGAVQLLSIHAAKGLEFPVVVVADLGREARRSTSSPRLIHDPAFGLACMLRDEKGEWQKPAGYRWAEWLLGQMEAAESRRLLYVACTRAADLLILSGRSAGQGSWMQTALEAWGIDGGGEADQIYHAGEFSLRVLRPEAPADERNTLAARSVDSIRPTDEQPALTEIPPLAQPFIADAAYGPVELPELVPAVEPAQAERQNSPAAGPRLDRLLRRLLAEPGCLRLSAAELDDRLDSLARREGLPDPQVRQKLLAHLRRALAGLARSPLGMDIAAAQDLQTCLPYTPPPPLENLSGEIDLLYRQAEGGWGLVAWETGWTPAEALAGRAAARLPILTAAAEAVRCALGVRPTATVCALLPRLALHTFTPQALEAAWDEHTGLALPSLPPKPGSVG